MLNFGKRRILSADYADYFESIPTSWNNMNCLLHIGKGVVHDDRKGLTARQNVATGVNPWRNNTSNARTSSRQCLDDQRLTNHDQRLMLAVNNLQ